MKKMASLLVVAALLICMAVPAFAATGINTYEEKLITYVKTAYVVDGTTISVPDEYVTALENIFSTVDLTEDQYNQIKGILDEALEYCKANNLVRLSDITEKKATNALLAYANKALGVVGYSVTASGSLADADHGLLTILDSEGKVVAKLHPAVTYSKGGQGGTIAKTGADFTSAAFCGLAAVAVLSAAGVAVKKFRKDSDD